MTADHLPPLTDAELDALDALHAALPPGDWFVNERTERLCYGDPTDDRDNYPVDDPGADDFTAAAHNALPRLTAEVRRLRGEVHDCPDCGLACKQCPCVEKRIAELAAAVGHNATVAREWESRYDALLKHHNQAVRDQDSRAADVRNRMQLQLAANAELTAALDAARGLYAGALATIDQMRAELDAKGE